MKCTNLHFDGLTDETINQGADFDALEGVKAYDADGNEIDFSVEPEEFDSCAVGEQTLVYKAMGKDNRLIPSMCIPKDSSGANLPLGCTLTLLKENRKITVLQADPPRFIMNDVTIPKNTTLDVLYGVSAVDDNGNPITDIDYSGYLDKQASGDIASITDGQSVVPVKSLKVTLEPIQSGSGTPSPTNIRPISGHTEVVTEVCGVNVWDEEWRNGYYTAEGAFVANSGYVASKNMIPVLPSTTYNFHTGSRFAGRVSFYDANEVFISGSVYTSSSEDFTFTTTENTRYMSFDMTGSYGNTYKNDISINYPSTDTSYHAFDGATYTTALGRTVYGGTLEQVGGELDDTMAMIDLSTLTWLTTSTQTADGSQCHYADVSGMATDTANTGMISDRFALASGKYISTMVEGTMIRGGGKIYVATDADTISGQLCYPLATPQTYQLDPQTISLLHGNNNVWSDGSVVMVYSIELPTDGEVSYPLEGEYEITYSASDKCGNVGEAIRHITVQ